MVQMVRQCEHVKEREEVGQSTKTRKRRRKETFVEKTEQGHTYGQDSGSSSEILYAVPGVRVGPGRRNYRGNTEATVEQTRMV